MPNHATYDEIDQVKNLIYYLNQYLVPAEGGISLNVDITDANGEPLGRLTGPDGNDYVWEFPA